MDNVFVIALIFSYFAIPRQYQHRVLFWGILGVIVLRALMIDLVFAVDSVPAIFAILGLRALYFALAAMIHRFKYLKYALALVLVFIGAKIFLVGFIGKMPPSISLAVTFGLIVGGVLVSLWKTRGQPVVAASC